MKRVIFGVMLAIGLAGVAQAADFIVVSSDQPTLHAGESLEAGAHVPLAPGKSLTVIRTSGEVTVLHGGPQGATLPPIRTAQADPARFDTLKALFQSPPSGRAFGARRGFCPTASALTTMDAIVNAYQNGCHTEARQAMTVFLHEQGSSATVGQPAKP